MTSGGSEYYFYKETGIPMCVLCGKMQGIAWCGKCGEYFCNRCKRNYPLRIKAMLIRKGIIK